MGKKKDRQLGEWRERCYTLLGQLRNNSLASLSAEWQDSVCKQSVHVRVVTWRRLLSCCPCCLIPEVNPDIDIHPHSQQQSLRPCAITEPYLSLYSHTSERLTAHSHCGKVHAAYSFLCVIKCSLFYTTSETSKPLTGHYYITLTST